MLLRIAMRKKKLVIMPFTIQENRQYYYQPSDKRKWCSCCCFQRWNCQRRRSHCRQHCRHWQHRLRSLCRFINFSLNKNRFVEMRITSRCTDIPDIMGIPRVPFYSHESTNDRVVKLSSKYWKITTTNTTFDIKQRK